MADHFNPLVTGWVTDIVAGERIVSAFLDIPGSLESHRTLHMEAQALYALDRTSWIGQLRLGRRVEMTAPGCSQYAFVAVVDLLALPCRVSVMARPWPHFGPTYTAITGSTLEDSPVGYIATTILAIARTAEEPDGIGPMGPFPEQPYSFSGQLGAPGDQPLPEMNPGDVEAIVGIGEFARMFPPTAARIPLP